jgi:hypothetical protein
MASYYQDLLQRAAELNAQMEEAESGAEWDQLHEHLLEVERKIGAARRDRADDY